MALFHAKPTRQAGFSRSERVAYLRKRDTFVWVEHQRSPRTLLQTQTGPVAGNLMMTGAIVVTSPNQQFIAVAGNGMDLWTRTPTGTTSSQVGILGSRIVHGWHSFQGRPSL